MDSVGRKYFLFIPFLLISFGLRSQFTGWSASAGYGKMLNIHPFTPEFHSAFFLKGEYIFMPEKVKDWHLIYHVKELGWGFSFIDHGNAGILGKSVSISPKIAFEKPLGNKLKLKPELGFGLAYFFKPYNNISNPDNYIIGSPFTADACLSLSLSYQNFDLGFAFRHFSNGHVAVPNVGSNIPFVFLRYSQRKNKPNSENTPKEKTSEPNKKFRFSFNGQLGIHEIEGTARPVDGPKFGIFGGQLLVEKIINLKSKLRLGSSFSYYQSFRNYAYNQNLFDQYSWWNATKITTVLGHEFMFGHTGFFTDFMYNIYYPFKKIQLEQGKIEHIKWMHKNLSFEMGFNFYYHKIKSHKKPNPYWGIGIRTIGGKADYIFTRVGISIW